MMALRAAPAATTTAARAALLCLALLLPSALAAWMDPRSLDGVPLWAKPIKFQLSFGLHWLTLLWMLRLFKPAESERPVLRRWVMVAAVCTAVELGYITLQAARGRASHFNHTTPLEAFLYYGVMGPAAVLIVLVTAWLGWRLWRHARADIGRGLTRGAALGLMLSGLATLLVASPLAAGLTRIDAAAGTLPLVGWSSAQGDLRVAHFFATHLLQALPLAGWLADRAGGRVVPWGLGLACALGLAVVVATTVQALRGQAFIPA